MTSKKNLPDTREIEHAVQRALEEDIGPGDITAELIPIDAQCHAHVLCREDAVVCGLAWFDEVFRQVDSEIEVNWDVSDGTAVHPGSILCRLSGSARNILTGERAALNFLQTLSGTATVAHQYAKIVADLPVRLLDTRKTIPGLRRAQKYAVACGGCHNHRIGLWDAFLIKENHISACGSIAAAIARARKSHPDKLLEVEVESIGELKQALSGGADRIMLDNFETEQIREAVEIARNGADLEVSGNVEQDRLRELAETGVDYISIGALTKHCRAIDLSLRVD